jgi:predicted DNA-binding protein
MNAKDCPHFTLRIDPVLLDKLGYIAKYNGRTKNKEVERLIMQHIEDFEKQHGKITYPDMYKA